jgi:quercetin dioxygenase-like cupin family protein
MPYEADAINRAFLDLDALIDEQPDPPWRLPVVADSAFRVILFRWSPGMANPLHFHPRAAEIFMILRGRAIFEIGEELPRAAGPGELMFAAPGVKHTVYPTADEEMVMLAVLGPNEDEPDETIDLE